MGNFFKNLFGGGVQQIGSMLVGWVLGLPFVASIMTIATGIWIYQVPWPYLIAATSVTFAMVMTAILRFSEWRARTNPYGKLRFGNLAVEGQTSSGERGVPQAIRLGFSLDSIAEFPLEFHVEEVRSIIGSRANQNPQHLSRSAKIAPQGGGFFRDDWVQITPDDLKGSIVATFSYKLKYGRPGNLKFTMEQAYSVVIGVTEEKLLTVGSWSEIGEDSTNLRDSRKKGR